MPTIPTGAKKPTDRRAPAKPSVRQSPAARRKAEAEALDWFEGKLNGQTIRVCSPEEWRASAMEGARLGDIFLWGQEGAVHPDDVSALREANPRGREIGPFIQSAVDYFGAETGE